jgi:hypothetical protein
MLDPEDDARMIKMDTMVANEDGRVLWGIRPVLAPSSNIRENLVPTDKHTVHYREKIKEWESMGWRIDSDAVERDRLKTAYAIPSPQRRKSKNWTLDPIPLIPSRSRAANKKTG